MINYTLLTRRSISSAVQNLHRIINNELDMMENNGTLKTEYVIRTPQNSSIKLVNNDKPLLNFCSNNYLGLANNEEISIAAKKSIDDYGNGLSSVRFICGTQDHHKKLESTIANFHDMEDAILYASCFDANAGLFETISNKEDILICDELNHASLIDGCRLSKATKKRYTHRNLNELEKLLSDSSSYRNRFIVTDGVFSMDGSVAPLIEITELAKKYKALVIIDECHATGFFGPTGRGTSEHFDGVKVDIINSTLGKAMGGAIGGYTAGSKEVVSLLRQKSRPYLFSNSLSPPLVSIGQKAFEIIERSNELQDKLHENTKQFRDSLRDSGLNIIGDKEHPICPILLKDVKLTVEMARRLLNEGIYVIAFSFPVVPKDLARIRTQMSAAHSKEDIEKAVNAIRKISKSLNII
ncbi:hypothetical protein SNEBB_000351 [Seison nebaliae]|nr:hypothetical protein SNEBB_000351 [Seison nebaliae]